MGAIQLRPYQTELVDSARANMKRGHKSVLIQLPTGGGKTCIAAFMLKTAREKGLLAYFMCHRRELITQTVKTLHDFDVPCGTIAASHPADPSQLVQVCSVPTVARRLSKIPVPSLIFWDECQFIGAKTWTAIYKNFPNSYHVLLSATPTRMDGKALGEYASIMVKGPSMRSLIDQGFLSDYRLFAPSTVSLAGVKTQMGDYNKTQLNEVMEQMILEFTVRDISIEDRLSYSVVAPTIEYELKNSNIPLKFEYAIANYSGKIYNKLKTKGFKNDKAKNAFKSNFG